MKHHTLGEMHPAPDAPLTRALAIIEEERGRLASVVESFGPYHRTGMMAEASMDTLDRLAARIRREVGT